MRHLIIVVLLTATSFAKANEESLRIAGQIAKPLLHWIYFTELPPGTAFREDRKVFWSPILRDRLRKSAVQVAWVSVTTAVATNTFTFDIGRRLLVPTALTEAEFLRANAIGDGEAGLYQFLVVRIHAAAEPAGFAVSLNTGSTCHGKYGSASFDRTGQTISLTSAALRSSKCCF